MSKPLTELPLEWESSEPDGILETGAISYLKFLGRKLFQEYEPAQFGVFEDRLVAWLNNLDDDYDRKIFLSLLLDLFFVGRREFEALYRSVYSRVLAKWVIDQCNLNPFSLNVDAEIQNKLNDSWICPITDSLRINSFLKVCNLKSMEHRPDWKSLAMFSDIDKVHQYIETYGISRLILLEDFIGSGTQAKSALEFIGENIPQLEVLVCPLVICPKGDQALKEIADRFEKLSYSPGLLLPPSETLNWEAVGDETEASKNIRDLFKRLRVRFGMDKVKPMYGFKGTGSQVVMYSNCPNNTLRIYHHDSDNWTPLFRRVTRV